MSSYPTEVSKWYLLSSWLHPPEVCQNWNCSVVQLALLPNENWGDHANQGCKRSLVDRTFSLLDNRYNSPSPKELRVELGHEPSISPKQLSQLIENVILLPLVSWTGCSICSCPKLLWVFFHPRDQLLGFRRSLIRKALPAVTSIVL